MVSVLEIGITLMTFTHKIFTGVSITMSFPHVANLAWSDPSPVAAAHLPSSEVPRLPPHARAENF